jgi:tight adherence protein C
MFFRVAMPFIIAVVALLYLFVLADYDYPVLVKIGLGVGAGYIGFYVPNMFIQNLVQRRQTSIKSAFPDALDMLLICVQSGMSIEAAFQKVSAKSAINPWNSPKSCRSRLPSFPICRTGRQAFENLGKRTGIPASRRWPPP